MEVNWFSIKSTVCKLHGYGFIKALLKISARKATFGKGCSSSQLACSLAGNYKKLFYCSLQYIDLERQFVVCLICSDLVFKVLG